MAGPPDIPRVVISRMSSYLRELERLKARGVETISSAELGRAIGAGDAQVRKDLAYFGQFGRRGVGYDVAHLVAAIRSILSLEEEWHVVLVGAGNVGRALCTFRTFADRGFRIVALFDDDPRKVGLSWARLRVQPMADLPDVCRDEHVEIGIIAVPAEGAQGVADQLVAAGVRGIFNFAPTHVNVPEGIEISHVDLAVPLEQLAFLISHRDSRSAEA
jgi:redox-sensing transcriptional repressor